MEKNVICDMKMTVTREADGTKAEGRADFDGTALDMIATLAHVFEIFQLTEEEAVQYTMFALHMRYGEGSECITVKMPTMGNEK